MTVIVLLSPTLLPASEAVLSIILSFLFDIVITAYMRDCVAVNHTNKSSEYYE